MEEEIPRGFCKVALVSITNKKRDLFYFQQKDESYPIKEWALGHTFFGGHIIKKEKSEDALRRELSEELDSDVTKLIMSNINKLFVYSVPKKVMGREYHFFESVLSDKELDLVSKGKVREGKGGFLIKKSNINSIKIMPIIQPLVEKYFSSLN